MKICTKVGDEGKTCFFGCGMVDKDDPRIEAFGAIDELNSTIGVTLCFIENEKLRNILIETQDNLFTIGADLAGSEIPVDTLPKVTDQHLEEIEATIKELGEKLSEKFVLPGGTVSSSFLHLCRAITRRAERSLVHAKNLINLNPLLLKYINRLSDLFYVLARQANKELDVTEQQPIYKYFKQKKES